MRPARHFTLGASLVLALASGCGLQTDPAKIDRVANLVTVGFSNKASSFRAGPDRIDSAAGVLAVQREIGRQTAGLGLVSRRAGIETWSTQDGTTLTLEDGVVIGTVGFGPDLFSVEVDPVRARPLGQPTTRIHRSVDGENHLRLEAYVCEISVDHTAKVAWDGKILPVSRFDENCTGPNAHFENFFIYSRSGRLLGSRQWINGELGYFLLHMPRSTS